MPVDAVLPFEEALFAFAEARHPAIFTELVEKKELSDTLRSRMDACIAECKAEFLATRKA
jgi:F0F1-type ATP synthase alpha subunit